MNWEHSILIIGNKPYKNFQFNDILDRFEHNCRCNMSLPNKNNGTKYERLALCNHLYVNLINPKVSLRRFIEIYESEYIKEEIIDFFSKFEASNFTEVFLAKDHQQAYNQWLKHKNCPYAFSKQPRTGYVVLFDALLNGEKVFVTHFSINKEERESYYVQKGKADSECHCATDEVSILRWLHSNSYVDASLCLLEDVNLPTLASDDLEVSESINMVLNSKNEERDWAKNR